MKIRFYANLRKLIGQSSMDVTDSGIDTLRKLLNWLFDAYPDLRPLILDASAGIRQDVPIFVNGRNPRLNVDGIDMHLRHDDVISVFTPISSGKMNVEVLREPIIGELE
jgi:MoaD family protein